MKILMSACLLLLLATALPTYSDDKGKNSGDNCESGYGMHDGFNPSYRMDWMMRRMNRWVDSNDDIADGTLIIKGERKRGKDDSGNDYRHIEHSYGEFYRSLTLPPNVDADKIKAKMTAGVLEIHIPRTILSPARKS